LNHAPGDAFNLKMP